jgi:hypothetical protein
MFVRLPVPPREAGMLVIRARVNLAHAPSGCVVDRLGLEVVIQGTRAEELSYEPPARRHGHGHADVGSPGWIGRVHIASLN